MNHCYRLVFNAASLVWQAVAETAKSHGKSSKAKTLLLASILISSNAYADPATNALPTGGQVVSGQSTISQAANQLNILQSTQKSIINWGSYNIGANATVNYVQPNASAISLNRVTGQDPSQIFGHLNANGQVWLINPNGILFGQSAQVNVGGLVASTLNISDDDFLSSNYKFAGNTGNVINMGNIVANNGGYVAMFSPQIRNEGIISALQGASILATGDAITMDFAGNSLINVQVDSANINTLIENKSLIKVGGGQVLMSARAADGLMTSVINNSGRIEADSMVSVGGTVRLTGAKTVINSGEISAQSSAGKGGNVQMLGENVGIFDAGSINVNGKTGGGTILVGGDFQGKNSAIQNANKTFVSQNAKLSADATQNGDGGKVIVWADNATQFLGNISAKGGMQSGNGGFVEVSGKQHLNFIGAADTRAQYGNMGILLLDPTDITISTGANSIESTGATTFQETTPTPTSILNTTTLQTALAANNVVVTTASAAANSGNITISNAVTWASGNSLTLTANNNIAINAAVTTGTSASSLILNAAGNVTQSGAGIIGGAGSVTKNGAGTFTMTSANSYTGATNVNTGSIILGGSNRINDASALTVAAGASFNMGNFAETVGSIAGAGNITRGTGLLTTGGNNTSTNFSGIINGTVGLVKTGTGTLTLGGINTYTGPTTISGGTLSIGAAGSIATSSAVVNNAAFSILGNQTIDSMTGAGSTNLGANTLTIGDASNTPSTYNGIISGAGGLTKAGLGTLTLSAANAYTGATTINAGTLTLNATGSIAASSGVAVNVNGILNIGGNKTIDSITGVGSVVLGANTLTIGDSSNTNSTYDGVISGTGGVTKAGAGTLTLNNSNSYSGATNINAGSLTLGAANRIANASAITVASGATFNLNNFAETVGSIAGAGDISLGTGTLTAGGNNTSTTFSGVMSGAAAFTKQGTGTMTVTGANTYTGATTVSAGTLVAANNAALGGTGTGTTVATGATLALQGDINIVAEALSLNGTGVGANGALRNISGNNTYGGVVTLAGNSEIQSDAGTLTLSAANSVTGVNRNLTLDGAGNTNINGTITTGTGTLTKTGTGTATLSGANTYTGATTVSAGTLVAANNTALGAGVGATTVASSATLALQGDITVAEVLNLTGTGVSGGGALRNISGNNTVTGAITLGAGGARINSDAGLLTISGAGNITGAQPLTVGGAGNTTISKVIATGAGTLTKTGTGTLILSGTNTYTGNTTVNAGTLRYGTNNAISTGGVIVNDGGSYDLAGFNDTIGALTVNSGTTGGTVNTGTGTLTLGGNVTSTGGANNATINGNLALGAAARTFTITNAADGLNVSAIVSGAAGLNKAGNGTLTLSGANTYTGATAVNTGTLVASNANALGAIGGGTTVASGATLNVNNVTLAESAISINGTGVGAAGALTGTNAAVVSGTVTTTGASNIGTTSAASTLTLNGVTTATAGNLGIVGAGDVIATNANNNFGTVNINGANNVSLRDTNAITIGNGASNLTGNLTVRAGGNVTLANSSTSTGGDITLAGINFINNAGASALTASGRWLVYANTHTGNTFGALDSANQAVWNTAYPAAVLQTGNRYVFANNPGTLTVTSTNQTKTYGQDGALTVANAYNVTGTFINAATFGNVFTQDTAANTVTGTATSTGSTVTANVGSYAIDMTPITANNGYTLTKSNAGNLTVNKANITVSSSNVVKTYDATTSAAGAANITSGTLFNGNILTGGTFAFTNANAGVGNKTVTVSGVTVNDGNAGGNYNVTLANNTTSTINKANASVTANSSNVTYNGLAQSVTGFTATGLVGGETTAVLTGVSTSGGSGQNAGSYSHIASGTDGNYNLAFTNGALTINKANATVTANSSNVTYNGLTQSVAGFTATGLVGGETAAVLTGVSTSGGSGQNAGSYSHIASGTDGNYNLAFTNGALNIGKANATVTANSSNVTYNGLTQSVTGFTATGLVNSETVAVLTGVTTSGGSGQNVGSYSHLASGTDSNYNLAFTNGALSINPANLTVTANNQTKTYGNTFIFAGTEFTASGLQNGETIGSVSLASPGAVNTANVNFYPILASLATGGTFDANNYNISYFGGNFRVDQAIINLNGTRSYNATTAFNAGDFGVINGVLGQTLNLTGAGSLASKNVGTQTVAIGSLGLTNGTGSASNYTLTGGTYTGTINQANLALNASSNTKVYDGTTNLNPFGPIGPVGTAGLFSPDTVTATQSFASKNVLGTNGSTLNVDAGYTVIDGNGGNNYNVTTNSATGTITPLGIAGTITANNKVYDATNTATIATRSLTGVIAGDAVTYAGGTATFADKNVSTGKTVTAIGLGLTGADAGNYTVNTTATSTADISKANISAVTGITANNKTYDATTTASLNTSGAAFTGIFGGDVLNVSTATGAFVDANAGLIKTVNISGISLGGADAGNYNLVSSTANATADINKAALTVTANNATKTQGSVNPPFSSSFAGFVGGETSAVLTGVLGHNTLAVTSSPAGSYSITPFGLSAANYDITFVNGVLSVVQPANFAALGIGFNPALTRPQQATQTCGGGTANDNAMISGLEAFGADDVEYKQSASQPLIGGVVANALVSPACLKL